MRGNKTHYDLRNCISSGLEDPSTMEAASDTFDVTLTGPNETQKLQGNNLPDLI